MAKISPKMAKKQPFFDFFRFSLKLSIRFERNFLQLFYTILESYMCNGIKIVWLGCEKQPKLAQKWPKNSHFSTFFDFLKNCPYDSNEIFYSHSTPYYGPLCAISLNSYGWDVRNIAKFSPKMAKKQSFFDFFDFLTNSSYDSNERESEGKRLKPTPLPHMRLWFMVHSWSFSVDVLFSR